MDEQEDVERLSEAEPHKTDADIDPKGEGKDSTEDVVRPAPQPEATEQSGELEGDPDLPEDFAEAVGERGLSAGEVTQRRVHRRVSSRKTVEESDEELVVYRPPAASGYPRPVG